MPTRRTLPKWPTLNLERACEGRVCGIDEAGYAPIAGPVVAAAVVLPRGAKPRRLRGLTDSKLLPPDARDRFFDIIHSIGDVGVGMAEVEEIDRLNIFHANMLAMRRAVEALETPPDIALVDGRAAPPMSCQTIPVVKGDRRSLSIAAASVVAKVVRDRLMRQLAERFPGYGWRTNVGYGTDHHYLGLLRKGPTDFHRRTFAPLTTLFAADGPELIRNFRVLSADERADLKRVELVALRQDLHAVFEGGGRHVGLVKNLRGRWTFQAVGYGRDREPEHGGGPCASCHGERLAAPERRTLVRLFGESLS